MRQESQRTGGVLSSQTAKGAAGAPTIPPCTDEEKQRNFRSSNRIRPTLVANVGRAFWTNRMSSAFFVLQSNKDKFRIVTVTIPTFKLADSHDFDSIKLVRRQLS